MKKYRRRRNYISRRKSNGNEDKIRFIVIGLFVVFILLIAAVVLTVRRNSSDRQLSESAAEVRASIAEVQQAESESAAAARVRGQLVFQICDIDEITGMVYDYFDARLAADSSRIYEIFGRNDTSPNEDFEDKLEAQASWIQAFTDIIVYTVPGENDDDYLCIVTYNIDFRRTDTLAPGIMYFFAVSKGDGSYVFAENILKEKVDYAAEVLEGESARALIEDTDERLKAALDSDSTLALIYVSFQNGEIYKENELNVDADQSVNFMDPADSILVDEDVLAEIKAEAEAAAEREALEGASDIYNIGEDEETEEPPEQDGSGSIDASEEDEERQEAAGEEVFDDGENGAGETEESESGTYAVYSAGGTGPGPGSGTSDGGTGSAESSGSSMSDPEATASSDE